MNDFGLTDLKTKLVLLSQEQQSQIQSLGEIRLALYAILERLKQAERRIATLEAPSYTGSIQGLDGTVTVSFPPEWGETVPLVEIENVG